MVNDEKLLQIAQRNGHKVVYFPLPETGSLSVPTGETGCIGLDLSLRGKELTTRLAHELGHCEYGGFYSRAVPLDIMEKSEYRANKWAVEHIIPFDRLQEAVHEGIATVWELSDYFGVTEDMIRYALTYYTEAKGYVLNDGWNEV